MTPSLWPASVVFSLALASSFCGAVSARGDDAGTRQIPAAFAPFEYLVGRWSGQGMPKDNPAKQFRGWPETHTWAWAFAQGKMVGLSVTIEGGKILASGRLTYDSERRVYRLEGLEPQPAGIKATYEGTLDKTGKYLFLDHVGAPGKNGKSAGSLRLAIRPNANYIRYTMVHELKEPGSIQFTKLIEVGVTKDGESLAGATTIAERPRCIVTGGAATMTMSYQGRSFPICCTGCRDEFNDNPEKYIKKAALMAASPAGAPKAAAASAGRSEDAFSGDVADPTETARPGVGGSGKAMAKSAPAAASAPTVTRSSPKNEASPTAAKQASRAASLLKLGQSLEKSGKTTAALGYYRQIAKDFARTPAAKTAAERIKALEKP